MDYKRDINKPGYGAYQASCDDPYMPMPTIDMTVKFAPSQAEDATPSWAGPQSYTPTNSSGGDPEAGKR
jgi:hypothetical protein